MSTVTASKFLVKDFYIAEDALELMNLKEFCKMNSIVPSSDVTLTKENGYKGLHFTGVSDSTKRLFLMFGKASAPKVEVGDPVSTKWGVAWIEDKGYYRVIVPASTVSIDASEWE